ncbi:MAG: DNA mismatch repair protein MutS [Chloroflexi bacterium 44-23]|nr:MAG: DNA mismatch repair protein MutS [Chloroflexi bacterium 44-23]
MTPDDITPIRKQYLDIKKQYPDSIVFFRMGDFYETFDRDAEITSRELEIVLTSRNVAKGVRIPMAGIPYHAVDNYLSRLIGKGYHVAIAEQIGETQARGLVHREVVRVVTPGTVIEPGLLNNEKNNYLACVVFDENRIGIAYVDITTGEFRCTEIQTDDVLTEVKAELDRLKPAEVLLPESLKFEDTQNFHITRFSAWHFEFNRAQTNLKQHFQTSTLEGFGVNGKILAICASGAILDYLGDTQPAALKLLSHLSVYSTAEFMNLDAATRRNLELTETIRRGEIKGSLLHVLDKTVTPMGHRLMRQWVSNPLIKIDEINVRQECITFFTQQGLLRAEAAGILQHVNDLERLVSRVIAGHATPRDLGAIRNTLEHIPVLMKLFALENNPDLETFLSLIHNCTDELTLLKAAIADEPPATLQNSGVIKCGYSSELDQVVSASQNARDWINNLERIEKDRTGIKTLKVGYNKVFGYYIEVTRSNSSAVPVEYIRKQTLVNAERYITPEMKEYETLVLNAEERIREIEGRIFSQICEVLAKSSRKLLQTARGIGELDVYIALANVAVNGNYTRPILVDSTDLEIYDGRHPVVETYVSENRFIPNDSKFENGEIVRIITGPNMSGKSTFLRQVALIVLMAQIGSFVPASSATIGITDRIFTRIGAQDEIHAGQSTFMVEMIETANILNHATNRSLLILDEIGRGTSTYDGLSIAWAVVEYIHNHPKLRARTLFATHYHELTQLSELLPGVRNYNVAVSEADNNVVFLHKIVAGGADRSYGIHVGQLAGLPRPVVQRAAEILKQLESSSGKAINLQAPAPQQMLLFPETNPIISSLKQIDIDSLSPIEALNKLYEWKRKFME